MTLPEMHVYFRQYAQQMGMQNVRAILPEQIDIVINTSITDTVNQVIANHIAATSVGGISTNAKLGQINTLRNIYKVKDVDFSDDPDITFNEDRGSILRLYGELSSFNYFYMVGLSICYTDNNVCTKYFPIRIIDDIYLSDTLEDSILKPTPRSPIAVMYNGQLDLYIGDLVNDSLPCDIVPNKLRISYIEKPATVQYNSSNPSSSVPCNLPEYTHVDIVKHAVDLYRISVNNGVYENQQRQSQNSGVARGSARPDVDTYQS